MANELLPTSLNSKPSSWRRPVITNRAIALTCALFVVHVFGIVLFLKGFCTIPSAEASSGGGGGDDVSPASTSPQVGRVVIVVIDAFRADFVTASSEDGKPFMPYLQVLSGGRHALVAATKVHPPTVTLPRIKSMVSGSIPAFADVFNNFASDRFTQDNVISRAKRSNRTIVFYGDETWIRMFPSHFERSEGTTSFFVNDYTEVDDNVTRHLDAELLRSDWDIMILHYLGLDHIGHVGGPRSPSVGPKLKEMDDVIQKIHTALLHSDEVSTLPSLLLVCGDHGMSDAGGHGGSSHSETTVPTFFIGSFVDTIKRASGRGSGEGWIQMNQVDLCPTLSVLLGLQIPRHSIGKVLIDIIDHLSWEDKLLALRINAEQVVRIACQSDNHEGCSGHGEAKALHEKWRFHNCSQVGNSLELNCPLPASIEDLYSRGLNQMLDMISGRHVQHDLPMMVAAMILLWMTLILAIIHLADLTLFSHKFAGMFGLTASGIAVALHVLLCNLFPNYSGSCLCTSLWLRLMVPFIITLLCQYTISSFLSSALILKTHLEDHVTKKPSWFTLFLVLCFILHTISLLSSSFVEEEHQTWYFVSTTTFTLLLVNEGRHVVHHMHSIISGKPHSSWKPDSHESALKIMCILIILRILRDWNHTGNKWAHLPDIARWLDSSKDPFWRLAVLFLGTIIITLQNGHRYHWPARLAILFTSFFILLYRVAIGALHFPILNSILENQGVVTARLAYLGLVPGYILCVQDVAGGWLHATLTAWSLLSSLLLQSHNVMVFASMGIQEELLHQTLRPAGVFSTTEMTLIYVVMAQCAFFQQGNCNSLSCVDLAGGYVGLGVYKPGWVGFLIFCTNYAGPIFWLLSLMKRLSTHQTGKKSGLQEAAAVLLVARALPWALYTICVTVLRYHLFVWTVFSPKLLFETIVSFIFAVVVFLIGIHHTKL